MVTVSHKLGSDTLPLSIESVSKVPVEVELTSSVDSDETISTPEKCWLYIMNMNWALFQYDNITANKMSETSASYR